jgi:hypothetical protein
MKNQTLIRRLISLNIFLGVISPALLVRCSDDSQSTNEREMITTVFVTLTSVVTPPEERDTITLSWDDTNRDTIVDDNEVITSGPLLVDKTYQAKIQILNKSVDPEIVITEEIQKEAEDHILCFAITNAGISITTQDEDKNGMPVGLLSTWTTSSMAGTGTVNITLRHQPGVKTGDCPGFGDTDVNVTFEVAVAPID